MSTGDYPLNPAVLAEVDQAMAASSAGLDALTQSARTMQTKLEPVELWRFIADSVEDTHPKVLGALLATAILRAAQ